MNDTNKEKTIYIVCTAIKTVTIDGIKIKRGNKILFKNVFHIKNKLRKNI